MQDFIFHSALKQELQLLIDKTDQLSGVLCFHGLPGCGKTTFAKRYASLVAKEFKIYDANSHLFEKGSASTILGNIKERLQGSLASLVDDDFNHAAYFHQCFIIDEFHNFSATRQDSYKVCLEEFSARHKVLFILIVNTSKKTPLNKVLTPAIFSRVTDVDFDIRPEHFEEITALIRDRFPVLDENYIRDTLPDLRKIVARAKFLS